VANPAKRRGDQWERDVVEFLQAAGLAKAERAYGAGRQDDRGDIAGVQDWVLECKNHKAMDLAGWMAEALVEQANAGTRFTAVVIKRRNKPAKDGYVVMSLEQLAGLIQELQQGRKGEKA
jgi:Holliday junction resolvase